MKRNTPAAKLPYTSAKLTLEDMMKRRAKRMSAFEQRTIHLTHLKDALTDYLERLPIFKGKEIIDIDIPALTTEQVDIKIYTKEL
jgi:hypothetical protein